MITMTKIFMILTMTIVISALNPVKMSFMMLLFSFLTFSMLNKMSGVSWFSLIFFLLFMGGILIMFLILSSLMPNEKSLKSKINNISSMIVIFITLSLTSSSKLYSMPSLKWAMSSNFNMEIMLLLILGYFFSFIYLISSEKMSMRSM